MSFEAVECKIQKSESQENTKTTQCLRRCFHQEDRVCCNDDTTKEILKKIPDSTHSSSSNSFDKDSIHSGESLIKSFSFDSADADIEKCMSFWKSILSKNVKPIKCGLLSNVETKKKSVKKVKQPKKQNPCDEEETKQMWLNIYKDLQKKKLDNLRLAKQKRYDTCSYIDEDEEKKQDEINIKNLNTWKPKNEAKANKRDIKSQVTRTREVLHTSRTSYRSSNDDKEENNPTIDKTSTRKKATQKKTDYPQVQKSENKASVPDVNIVNNEVKTIFSPKKSAVRPEETDQPKDEGPEGDPPKAEEANKVCCSCGCDVEDCVCGEMADCINEQLIVKPPKHECEPCECSKECLCDEISLPETCVCGCNIADCICDNPNICTCGCNIDDCICVSLEDSSTGCPCGCGFEECICEKLFTKACKCGNSDCNCDMIATLNAYLDTLEKPERGDISRNNSDLVCTESQTENEMDWVLKSTQMRGSYCIICGHFNCHCTIENIE